jgi:hypothetical protein
MEKQTKQLQVKLRWGLKVNGMGTKEALPAGLSSHHHVYGVYTNSHDANDGLSSFGISQAADAEGRQAGCVAGNREGSQSLGALNQKEQPHSPCQLSVEGRYSEHFSQTWS